MGHWKVVAAGHSNTLAAGKNRGLLLWQPQGKIAASVCEGAGAGAANGGCAADEWEILRQSCSSGAGAGWCRPLRRRENRRAFARVSRRRHFCCPTQFPPPEFHSPISCACCGHCVTQRRRCYWRRSRPLPARVVRLALALSCVECRDLSHTCHIPHEPYLVAFEEY